LLRSLRRRDLIALLGSAAVALPAAVRAADKVRRIGIHETLPEAQNAANLQAFRDGLSALGYRERRDYVIDYKAADGITERFPESRV
jgi:hypothetical protein